MNVFKGGERTIRDKYSFVILVIESEADWKRLVNEFLLNSEAFVRHVESLTDSQLDEPFVVECLFISNRQK